MWPRTSIHKNLLTLIRRIRTLCLHIPEQYKLGFFTPERGHKHAVLTGTLLALLLTIAGSGCGGGGAGATTGGGSGGGGGGGGGTPPPPPQTAPNPPTLPQVWVNQNECTGTTSVTKQIPGDYPATPAGLQQAIKDANTTRDSTGKGTLIQIVVGTLIDIGSSPLVLAGSTTTTGKKSTNCIILDSNNPLPPGVRVGGWELQSISRGSNLVTAATQVAHGFAPGQTVEISNVSNSTHSFNGRFLIVSVPSATTFTYKQTGTNENGTVTPLFSTVAQIDGTTTWQYQSNNDMWIVEVSGSANSGQIFQNGTNPVHHYSLRDVELRPAATFPSTVAIAPLVALGSGTEANAANQAHDVGVDRIWIHGQDSPPLQVQRAIALNCAFCYVVNSRCDQVHAEGTDNQCIANFNGPGPQKIVNNYLEAGSENVLFGGADHAIPEMVESDLEIRLNTFSKNLQWLFESSTIYPRPHPTWQIKNGLEFKNVQRVLVDGNIIENSWVDAQAGFCMLVTLRPGTVNSNNDTIRDTLISNNVFRHCAQGTQTDGRGSPQLSGDGGWGQPNTRMWFINNLWYDIGDPQRWGQSNQSDMDAAAAGPSFPCTATRDAQGANTTLACQPCQTDCTYTGISPGDPVSVDTCSDASFNSISTRTKEGPRALAGTDPLGLTVVYPNRGTPNATSSCTLYADQGYAANVEVNHNTVINSPTSTRSEFVYSTQNTSTVYHFQMFHEYQNNIWLSGTNSSQGVLANELNEGSKSEATWELASFIFNYNVLEGRTPGNYTEYPGGQSPPVTDYFPADTVCTGAPDSTCIGFAGNFAHSDPDAGGAITGYSSSGGTATITTAVPHGFSRVGEQVLENYNPSAGVCSDPGTFTILSIPTLTTYTRLTSLGSHSCAGPLGIVTAGANWVDEFRLDPASHFAANQAGHAADGRDMGVDMNALGQAQRTSQYVCPTACGSSGPYPQ